MALWATCKLHGVMVGACAACWEDERMRLEGRVAELMKERDAAKEIAENCCKPAMEGLVKTEARIATLEAALKKYGTHTRNCDWYRTDPHLGIKALPCTCGLDTA